MEELILDLAGKFPWVLSVVTVIGVLRIVVKPLMSIAKAVAEATSSPSDNLWVEKVENSKIYKGFIYAIDWLASIKLKK